MPSALLLVQYVAILAVAPLSAGPLLASAFTTSHFSPILVPRPSSSSEPGGALSAGAGKGFGEKPPPARKKTSSPSATTEETLSTSIAESFAVTTPERDTGSAALKALRTREAEKRDAELRKLRDLRATDALLAEDAGAGVIPERVAQRMGKRMLPFVGIPLFGSFATFIGFWYLATQKDQEFQPAVVAGTSIAFLVVGLLGITYSLLSSSWDNDREGSVLGGDEFRKNVGSLKDGLSRTKENALLREKMAGLSESEIQRAIDDQEKREKSKNKIDARRGALVDAAGAREEE